VTGVVILLSPFPIFIEVEPNVALVRAIGGKEANAFLALATFTKLPKNQTFGHRLSRLNQMSIWFEQLEKKRQMRFLHWLLLRNRRRTRHLITVYQG
jgi:hypothetical protein